MSFGRMFEPVRRIDPVALRRAIAGAGGPVLELVAPMPGGEVGAWLVRWPDGHPGVLTWAPPSPAGASADHLGDIQALMEVARGAGVPVPRYEAVVDVGELGTAVIQERAVGTIPSVVTAELVDRVVELAEIRRGLLAGSVFAGRPMPLYLSRSGPGFCQHEPLRTHSARTAALLEAIEALAGPGDSVVGDDLVHLDYHLGNVLVDPERPAEVTAVLDWDGAASGSVALDLAVLAFDLTWRSPGPLQERVEAHLRATAEPDLVRRVQAHQALRLVDWSIRHYGPDELHHWLGVAEARLCP
jgi:hypothetical protein